MTEFDETPVRFRKSVRSGGSDCVEVAFPPGRVLVRDSKNPDDAMLKFSPQAWAAFLAGVQDGEFGAATPME